MALEIEDAFRNALKKDAKPVTCTECGGRYKYIGHGEYKCDRCNRIERDDYGKVYQYIELNGPSPAILISEGTGVPVDKINRYLREGKVEIPDGSDVYIGCENCGADIRYGRFCPACAAQLTKQLSGAFEAGETPKVKSEVKSHMRFLGKRNR